MSIWLGGVIYQARHYRHNKPQNEKCGRWFTANGSVLVKIFLDIYYYCYNWFTIVESTISFYCESANPECPPFLTFVASNVIVTALGEIGFSSISVCAHAADDIHQYPLLPQRIDGMHHIRPILQANSNMIYRKMRQMKFYERKSEKTSSHWANVTSKRFSLSTSSSSSSSSVGAFLISRNENTRGVARWTKKKQQTQTCSLLLPLLLSVCVWCALIQVTKIILFFFSLFYFLLQYICKKRSFFFLSAHSDRNSL